MNATDADERQVVQPSATARGAAGVRAPAAAERDEIIAALGAPQAWIAPKYFYDPLGSRLFEAITELPEYYPTRTERAIFERHGEQIAGAAGSGVTLIDLGAGNCDKAKRLFGLLRPAQYAAVDVSAEFLQAALEGLARQFPALDMLCIGTDFSRGLRLPPAVRSERRLFFYPGSSIGNFSPAEALALLADIHAQCGAEGGLLIGVDLVKPEAVLQAAYDDALGITAAFNLNVLRHLNARIGSDFDVGDWRHCALFNAAASRIEMHLEARHSLSVHWPGGARSFAIGERIHTENSYKYELADFEALLKRAGFGRVRAWTDERQWFAVCHAKATGT